MCYNLKLDCCDIDNDNDEYADDDKYDADDDGCESVDTWRWWRQRWRNDDEDDYNNSKTDKSE